MITWTKEDKIMKNRAFCGKKNKDCAACFKNTVRIFVA
jgi:hypothetical protein